MNKFRNLRSLFLELSGNPNLSDISALNNIFHPEVNSAIEITIKLM